MTLTVAVINADKDRVGDRDYLNAVRREMRSLHTPGVVCVVETKKGRRNVRMYGVGVKVRRRKWREVGDVGVHRDVEVAYVRVGKRRLGRRRRRVWLVCGHGPHRDSVDSRKDPTGQRAQDGYYKALKEDVLDELDAVGFFGDLNNKPAYVAKIIGGTPFGAEGDVMGGTVRGLTVVRQWATDIGRARGWTTHREAWVELSV